MNPPVKLAYMILAHRAPAQLVRLVERLDSEAATFFVHIDRKTRDPAFFRAIAPLYARPNVHFTSRVKHHWAFFGHIEATLRGIAAARETGTPFDHFVLITGQDYPIKPRAEIERHYAENRGRSFMQWFHLPRDGWPGEGGIERIAYRHYRTPWRLDRPWEYRWTQVPGRFIRRPGRRELPFGFEPYEGSSYWHLTWDAALYALEFTERNPEYRRFMKRTWLVDEIYFQTLIMNSPHAGAVVNDELRYLDWSENLPHPAPIEARHLPAMRASHGLFARKVDAERDPSILDLIDRELLGLGATSAAAAPAPSPGPAPGA